MTIVAHDNVLLRLATDQVTFFGEARVTLAKAALPVATFADGLTIHFNGEAVAIHHLPGGHTDGDAVVRFTESNVWHLGDVFFNGAFPLVDVTHGADVKP